MNTMKLKKEQLLFDLRNESIEFIKIYMKYDFKLVDNYDDLHSSFKFFLNLKRLKFDNFKIYEYTSWDTDYTTDQWYSYVNYIMLNGGYITLTWDEKYNV